LKTVLSLETELWRLYLGALFLATVMFFPSGLAGLMTMHGRPVEAGRWIRLIGPYLRMLTPAAAAVIALIAMAEMAFHLRRAPADEGMSLFWLEIDPSQTAPWIAACATLALGAWAARRAAPGAAQAFETATSPPRGSL